MGLVSQCFNANDTLTGAFACMEVWVFWPLLGIIVLLISLFALVKCLSKKAQRFEMNFKRTKGFWLGMTGGACALALIGMIPGGPFSFLFPIIAACMVSVYLADVDPAVSD